MSIYLPAGAGQYNTVVSAKTDETFNYGTFDRPVHETEDSLLAEKLGLIDFDYIQGEYFVTSLVTDKFVSKKNNKRFMRKPLQTLADKIKAELYRLNSKYKPSKLVRAKKSKKIAINKDDFNLGIYLVYEHIERNLLSTKNEITLKEIRQACAFKVTELLKSATSENDIEIEISEQNIFDTLRFFDKKMS